MHNLVRQNPLPKLSLLFLRSLRVVAGLQRLLSFPANSELIISAKHIYICIIFYSYSTIGTNENNTKIRMWTVVLLTTIRKARNHCQDVDHCRDEDHCQYHLGIDRCQDREHLKCMYSPTVGR